MGLLNDILNDVGAEMGRLGTLGRAELAAAIFSERAFVQYGDGQHAVSPQREPEQEVEAPAVEPPAIEEPNRGMEL
jgi:hypothetical protein